MRANQSFAGLLKPLVGESISGWIARGQHSKNPFLFDQAADAIEKFGAADADETTSGLLRRELTEIFDVNSSLFDYLFADYGSWLKHPQICEWTCASYACSRIFQLIDARRLGVYGLTVGLIFVTCTAI